MWLRYFQIFLFVFLIWVAVPHSLHAEPDDIRELAIKKWNQEIRDKDPELRPFLGVRGDPERKSDGFLVFGLHQDSPAHAANIKVGDIIYRVNDKEVNTVHSLFLAINEYSPGDIIDLEVVRKGVLFNTKVTLTSIGKVYNSKDQNRSQQNNQPDGK